MKKLKLALLAVPALLLVGCDAGKPATPEVVKLEALPDQPAVDSIETLDVQFEPAVRLRTVGGDFVSVESPGYASPTLIDINNDGHLDLIVGQFTGGKMKVYYGRSQATAALEFEDGDWLRSSGKPAEVPGIS